MSLEVSQPRSNHVFSDIGSDKLMKAIGFLDEIK